MNEPLVVLGCVHLGFKYADIEYAKEYMKWGKDHGAKFLILSDMFECALPHKGKGMIFNQILDPQEQLEAGMELLRPIKDDIIGYCSGNHSNRAYEVAGIDFDRTVAKELGLLRRYYPQHGLISHKVGTVQYKIAFTHGVDCGVDYFRNSRKLLRMYPTADICASSHNHVCATTKEAFFDVDGGGHKIHEVTFVSTGSNLNYPSYAGKALYPPQPKGYAVLWLGNTTKQVKADVSGIVGAI